LNRENPDLMQHGAIKIKEDGKILMRDFEEGLKEVNLNFKAYR